MTVCDKSAGVPKTSVRRVAVAGVAATAVLITTLGGWSATTPIASAVVTQGRVVIEGRNKSVQHRDGGLVAEIAATNGDHVQAGAVLIRLDGTEIAASLKMVDERLAAAKALHARLRAEKDGQAEITLAGAGAGSAAHHIAAELAAQTDILMARRDVRRNNDARLAETLAQIDQQETGLVAQIAALSDEIGYIDEEIGIVEPLFRKKLVDRNRLSQLRRTRAERMGSLAALHASKAMLENRRRDATLQSRQAEGALHEQVVTELQQVTAEIGQLELEQAALKQRMERIEIRAPASGVVHEMQVTTIGGVIAAGATVLEIVPQNRAAAVEARVPPDQIDEIHIGQTAELVPAGLAQQGRGRLSGKVRRVSAAAVPDPQTGRDFFRVEIEVAMDDFADAGVFPVPGMPVEIYLATGEHTVLAYLMDPAITHIRRAFRE